MNSRSILKWVFILGLVAFVAIALVAYSETVVAQAEIPEIKHARTGFEKCLECHSVQGGKGLSASHTGFTQDACLSCHTYAQNVPPPQESNNCQTCHGQRDLSTTLPSGEKLPLYVDPTAFAQSLHGKLSCTTCHSSIKDYPHPQPEAVSPQQSCSQCHQAVSDQYVGSVHGKAIVEQNNTDVPACSDCHSAHAFEDPRTPTFRIKSVELCNSCHGNAQLMRKYDISTNVMQSYLEDFHGATVAVASKQNKDIWVETAVCTDCHGVHDIKAVDDPESPVIKANLVATCAKCHADANTNFPGAWLSHYEPTPTKAPMVFLVKLFYRIMIPFIVLGLSAHVFLDLRRALSKR
ncbi:MAG: cytochrome c3 family protein [Chloroflexi bacterium]|nr:cytochrome c3 family protein [Chloroflexota bacterium]